MLKAKLVSDIETRLNNHLADSRLILSKVREKTPIQILWSDFIYFNREDPQFTVPRSEMPLFSSQGSFLHSTVSTFHLLLNELNSLECKPAVKERLANRLKEETISSLLVSRYLNAIAYHFSQNITNKMSVPLVSVSEDSIAGLVLSPSELVLPLGEKNFTYSHYLLALLELSEIVVDYTTNVIIELSTDPHADSDAVKRQYSLSLLNLNLLNRLQSGFQSLDLKNDAIRRKYDKLKYSLKKTNGIVYDLSLRKLIIYQVELD